MMSTTIEQPTTSPEQIDHYAEKAWEAFEAYRHTNAEKKAAFLRGLADRLDRDRNELTETASHETNLPVPRLDGEVTRTIGQLRFFADLLIEGSWVRAIIDSAQPGRKPLPRPDLRQMQQPLGPVAVFGASNFPFAYSVLGGDTVAALAAGCPVLYKANPGHPETSRKVAAIVLDIATETGMPNGVFGMIEGASADTGRRLVMHPHIKAVGFTGSFGGGKALFDAAARRPEPIPVYAEMGSVNPVFILPEAMAQQGEAIAAALAASNTASVGQFCTNPGIIVAGESPATEQYLQHFSGAIRQTPPAAMLTAPMHDSYEKLTAAVARKNYVSTLADAPSNGDGKASARSFRTDAGHFLQDKQLWEEMFGPVSIQVITGDEGEMHEVASHLPGQISVSVWGTDNDLAQHVQLLHILELKAGRIVINGVPTGVEVVAAMNHGGPFPATTDSKFTSVGTQSIYRFTRPVCYQNYPASLLPAALRDDNPMGIWRMVDGEQTREAKH